MNASPPDLGITLEAAGPQQVTGRLEWAPRLCTAGVVQTELTGDSARLVAQVTQAQAVIPAG